MGGTLDDFLNQATGGKPVPMPAPQQVETNNPYNLKPGFKPDGSPRIVYPGQTGVDRRGIAIFANPADATTAAGSQLQRYQQRAGKPLTFRQIARTYAPASDHNNPDDYAAKTSAAFGLTPDSPIDLSDPQVAAKLAEAHRAVEQGQAPSVQGAAPGPIDDYIKQAQGHADANNVPNGPSGQVSGVGGNPYGGGASDPNANGGAIPGGTGQIPRTKGGVGQNEGYLTSFGHGVSDLAVGGAQGINTIAQTIETLGAKGTDALGLTRGAVDSYAQDHAKQNEFFDSHSYNPNGWAKWAGELVPDAMAGGKASIAKLAEGKLLARALNYGVQGGVAGLAASGGKDMAWNTALGTGGGAILGPAVEAVAPYAIAGAKKAGGQWVANKASDLGAAGMDRARQLASRLRGNAVPDVVGDGMSAAEREAAQLASRPDVNPDGSINVYDDAKPEVTPQQLAGAIGSRSTQRGIESTTAVPQPVKARMDELVSKGVPDHEALRQADLEAVPGVTAMPPNVTRTPASLQIQSAASKTGTPEGNAINQIVADNNKALNDHIGSMVDNLGGIPAEGSAAQDAAAALAKASDAAKAKVSASYKAAEAADGDQRVSIDALRELLAKPSYKSATTSEGKQLVSGLNEQIAAMAKENGGRFTPDEIDQLAKSANQAYNHMGGGANHMVDEIKAALNESLDQFDKAGPAYRQARALHREWAQHYDNPQGISKLIQRDASGNFTNEDRWSSAEGMLYSKDPKPFIQVVKQLKANGSADEIARIKATIIQKIKEDALVGGADRNAQQTISPERWNNGLNKIGMNRLKAVFSPDELASLAHVGRVGVYLNEAVPGTVNTSNTAAEAALLKSLSGQGKGAGKWTHAALHAIAQGTEIATTGVGMPGAGNVVAGVVAREAGKGADRVANAKAAAKLAKGLKRFTNMDEYRQAANDDAMAEATRKANQLIAQALANRTAPALAGQRKQ